MPVLVIKQDDAVDLIFLIRSWPSMYSPYGTNSVLYIVVMSNWNAFYCMNTCILHFYIQEKHQIPRHC